MATKRQVLLAMLTQPYQEYDSIDLHCLQNGVLKQICRDAQLVWLARHELAVQVKLLFKLAAKKAPSIIFLGKQEQCSYLLSSNCC